jgi:hypothetical protein
MHILIACGKQWGKIMNVGTALFWVITLCIKPEDLSCQILHGRSLKSQIIYVFKISTPFHYAILINILITKGHIRHYFSEV